MAVKVLKFEDIIYVLGNQAADLDSTVCAFSLAALLEAANPGLKAVPLIQGERDDLRLKPEIAALFQRAGLVPEEDNFLNEDNPLPAGARVILVDHNRPDFPGLESSTDGIIDHHRDEGFLEDLPLRLIRKTGSCATLITELWHESGIPIPLSQTLILLSAIAVDTGYLNPEWGKTTPEDIKIYNDLSSALSGEEWNFVLSLLDIKLDLSHLNQNDHLHRDFKSLKLPGIRAGISSIPMTVEDFFSPGFFDSLTNASFMKENCPDLLIIMHSTAEPFRRQFSFFYAGEGKREPVCPEELMIEILKTLGGFTPLPSQAEGWHSFKQEDVTVSRKVLVPKLKKEFERQLSVLPKRDKTEGREER